MQILIKIILIFSFVSLSLLTIAQNRPAARDTFNWKAYYSNSFIEIDSINFNNLKGNWIASSANIFDVYAGGFSNRNGNTAILEIKGDKYRDTNSGPFLPFYCDKNMIVFYRETSVDTAYINKINKKELVISFKREKKYIQYEYSK